MSLRCVVLCVLCFLVITNGEIENLNEPVDLVLDDIQALITAESRENYILPNLYKSTRWFEVDCAHGYLTSLATLKRTGNVTVEIIENRTAIFEGEFGFTDLQFNYDFCEFNVRGYDLVSSKACLEVDKNELYLKVEIKYDDGENCTAQLKDINLKQFRGHLLIGTGLIHKFENLLIEWIVWLFRQEILEKLYDFVFDISTKTMPTINLCARIPRG